MFVASCRLNRLVMKVFMSRESSFSEISSATALVALASAISVSADFIFSSVSFTLTTRSSSDTVMTPVESEDNGGGGMVVTSGNDGERFAGVVSEVICWFSEVELTSTEPAKMLSHNS